MENFISNDAGAVTVDWVVLTAGLAGLGLASAAVVSHGVQDVSSDTKRQMQSSMIRTSFTQLDAGSGFEQVAGGELVGAGTSVNISDNIWEGWTSETGAMFQLNSAEYPRGVTPSEGQYALDMAEDGQHMVISRTLSAEANETYNLSFDAGIEHRLNGMRVYYGGELVYDIAPDTLTASMETHSIQITGGAGDGSDKLTFEGYGGSGNMGVLLDNVKVE